MKEIEKALAYLKVSKEYAKKNSKDLNDAKEVQNIINTAIEALEKQIPKKPKQGSRAIKVGIEGANCSICGALIFKSQCYCNRCGQEIDWSGENE